MAKKESSALERNKKSTLDFFHAAKANKHA